MSESVWMSNGANEKAHVPKGEVDDWKPRGWSESSEPESGELVWMSHPDLHKPAKFPFDAVEGWKPRGWVESPPEEPLSVLKDPRLVDPEPDDKPKTTTKNAGRQRRAETEES